MELITIFFGILTALASLWCATFLYGRFSANIILRIQPVWHNSHNRIVKLIIELENISWIRINLEKVLLVVEEFEILSLNNLGTCIGKEWIDFTDAERIFTTSTHVNPKEVLHIERLYNQGARGIFHVGLQAWIKYPWFIDKFGPGVRTRRQTRTIFLLDTCRF